jgi:hypothetical protein
MRNITVKELIDKGEVVGYYQVVSPFLLFAGR